jgi:hypothetical protein
MEQLNQFEDNYLLPLSKEVVAFCELPKKESLDSVVLLLKKAENSLKLILKNMKRYIQTGKGDINDSELSLITTVIEDLAESLRFEAETVQDVIEDETFKTACVIEAMRSLVTS